MSASMCENDVKACSTLLQAYYYSTLLQMKFKGTVLENVYIEMISSSP